jgi:predicted Rossmann fold flavoprotein
MMKRHDVCILGAGASGLYCALLAARRGKTVAVADHGPQAGRKLSITGGGRCNFGNTTVGPQHYQSSNPHFSTSALARFSPLAFRDFLAENGLDTDEEPDGKLFCRQGAPRVTRLLEDLCRGAGVSLHLGIKLTGIERRDGEFFVSMNTGPIQAGKLVVATGGLAWPQAGSSCFGYGLAESYGLDLIEPRPALAPLLMPPDWPFAALAGIALPARVSLGKTSFTDAMLFTHKGLSGPAILRISGSVTPGDTLSVDLLPGQDLREILAETKSSNALVKTILARHLPPRLLALVLPAEIAAKQASQLRKEEAAAIVDRLTAWAVRPKDVGGYAQAEVTAGGVDTKGISSKTMETLGVPGMYFIGEVLDVTGDLGGYNLHWAWASAQAAAQAF